MGMIAGHFQRLAALARPTRAAAPVIAADAAGLDIGGVRVAWSNMRRLHAYKRDIYVGDLLCIAILAEGDRVFEISDAAPGWNEAADAIEHFLPGSLPRAQWTLQLVAGKANHSVTIYPP